MNHHGKHVDDRHHDRHTPVDGAEAEAEAVRRPSEYQRGTPRPDNPQAEHEDRPKYTHDGGQVGGGIGATHDGGVLGGAGREGDLDGSTPPNAHEPGAGVDYGTRHGYHATDADAEERDSADDR